MESSVKSVVACRQGNARSIKFGFARPLKGYMSGMALMLLTALSTTAFSEEISPQMLEKIESLPRAQQALPARLVLVLLGHARGGGLVVLLPLAAQRGRVALLGRVVVDRH